MEPGSFDHLRDEGERIWDDVDRLNLDGDIIDDDIVDDDSLVSEGSKLNEYGEIEDEDLTFDVDDSIDKSTDQSIDDSTLDPSTLDTQVQLISLHHTHATPHSKPKPSWLKRSALAPNETDKEFELFKIFCRNNGGRSLDYISRLTNIPASRLNKVSQKNNWKRRSADYDRAELVEKAKQAETSRHERHLRKLEEYREEQEMLGQQMTTNAARIALIANQTLARLLEAEASLDVKDLPSMLNAAAKLAEVGKNLQSSALGVDSLLSALEEGEG